MGRVSIGRLGDFPANQPVKVTCPIGTLCVVNTAGGIRVLDDMCSHETASLSEGEYYDDTDEVECPLHASTFDVTNGDPTAPPARTPVRTYAVTITGDEVSVEDGL